MRVIAWTSAVALLAGSVGTAQGRPLAIEDFYRLRGIGNVELSPDGRQVAFTLSHRVEETNRDSTEVWVVAADGSSAPRREHAGPRPGPISWRGRQLVIGGDAPRGVPSLDGAWIAETRPTIVNRPARTFASEFERRHEERFRGAQFDWLEFQRDGQPFPVPNPVDPAVTPPMEIFVRAAGADGSQSVQPEPRQVTHLGLRPNGITWSRDAALLAFTADSAYRDERRYGAAQVWVATRDGRTTRRITSDADHSYSAPQFSPDGRWVLAMRRMSTDAVIARRMNHGGPTDLVLVPVAGGAERNLTATWDLLPSGARWSADGRWVYFTGGIGGATHLFRVAASGGTVEQVTRGDRRIGNLSFDDGMTRMAYTVGVQDAPPDVHVARIDGSGERRLTQANADVTQDIALGRAERVNFRSKDGTPIEGFLTYPAGFRRDGGPYPLVAISHGGPHSADGYVFDFKTHYFAANGYFVLKVNFRSSTGYGEQFLWATWGAWGDKDGEDVMAGIDHVIATQPVDRARVAAMGHSYGGFMTNWLITQYPDRFAAAIPGAGIVNWVSDYGTADIARTKETEFFGTPWEENARNIMIRQSPLTYAGRVRTPTLFIHGEVDQRVPYSEAEQMYVALKKNGVPAKMIQYEGMAHGITGSWNMVHRMMNELRWLDTYLKPMKP